MHLTSLTAYQQRMWEAECVVRGYPILHTGITLQVEGALDPDRLARAVENAFGRHELLCTGFRADGDTLHTGPAPAHTLRVLHHPELSLSAPDQAAVRERVEELSGELFPFTGEAAARAFLLLPAGDHALLVLSFHRLVMDLHSLHQVVTDITDAYRTDEPLPPAQPYSELLARRMRRRTEDLEFWRTELTGCPAPWLGNLRPEDDWTPRGAEVRRTLGAEFASVVRANARAARCTPVVHVIAAAATAALSLSGTADLTVATMADRRMASDAVGPLAQALLTRVGGAAPHGAEGVLAQVRRGLREGMAHQGVEFEEIAAMLAEEMGVERDGVAPLTVGVSPRPCAVSAGAVSFTEFDPYPEDARILVGGGQLDVDVRLDDDEPLLTVQYDQESYTPEWCETFADELLKELERPPGTRLRSRPGTRR
ncbi:condensation domain-containing protein [Streptomyces sp. NPDC015171]|uniref:condensation domain-containing protein n=1 Tax=Streptomyces sp. NPDC015171 TaxID=3364945 RepID=UPI0036FA99C1